MHVCVRFVNELGGGMLEFVFARNEAICCCNILRFFFSICHFLFQNDLGGVRFVIARNEAICRRNIRLCASCLHLSLSFP